MLGKVRAKQRQRGDVNRDEVVGLLLHGDAAMAGQGLVPETFELSELKGYRTGGTVHVVINNQIGFTTSPAYGRSGIYCSDVAKMVQAPIFHVNGDVSGGRPCMSAGSPWSSSQQFKKDVVVDMFCYRRHGHNETDEPSFTQPLMYRKIAALPTTREIYARGWPRKARSPPRKMTGSSRSSTASSRRRSRRPRATGRTRPIGWRAPGRASKARRTMTARAIRRSRSIC